MIEAIKASFNFMSFFVIRKILATKKAKPYITAFCKNKKDINHAKYE